MDFGYLPKEKAQTEGSRSLRVGTRSDSLSAFTLPQQSVAPPQFQPYEVRPLISMPLPKMSSMMPMKSPPIGIRFD
jgi:hypothetical protein